MFKSILIRIYLFLRLWGGLKPFLKATYSKSGLTSSAMDMGYILPIRYKLLILKRWWKSDHNIDNDIEADIYSKIIKRLKKQHHNQPPIAAEPLPEVSADIEPREFFKKFVKNPHPVVIRGLAKNLPAVEKWNKAFFEETYGDTQVHADRINYHSESSDIDFEERFCSLKEAINTPNLYLNASRDVFNANPDLEKDLKPIEAWDKYLGSCNLLMSQAFLGQNAEGAPFHCANAWNFFIMVDGEKQWTLVNPEYTMQMGAIIHPTVISVEACVTGKGKTWRDAHEIFTQYCPKYTTLLKKGDVLLNPPWWWHEIKNITPFSIGISSRWMINRYVETNNLFDLMFLMSKKAWEVQRQAFRLLNAKSQAGNEKLEEDLLRRYVNRTIPENHNYFKDFLNRSKEKDAA